MDIDNEFRSLIPPLTAEEYQGLEQSIIAEGCRDALVTWQGTLIDGHNRHEICNRHNIPYKTVEKMFNNREKVKEWIILNQFSRRNLSAYDRSVLALKLKELFAERAKENQGERIDLKINIPQKSEECKVKVRENETNVKLANIAGVSHDTIAKVQKIEEKAPVEVKQKIKDGELSINKAYTYIKRQEIKEKVKKIEPPKGKYRIIYADPPWQYADKRDSGDGGAEDHYTTMSIDELCKLPIKSIADDNAILFMWATSPLLQESFKVLEAWGFKYKTSFVWDKVKHCMGHYNSVRHELLLVCTRGSCLPDNKKLYDSVLSIERSGKHSEKPEEFRHIIDDLYTYGNRIELFSRKTVDGWEVWGNQI